MPVLELIMQQTLRGQDIQNTFFYEGPTLAIADGQNLSLAIRDLYNTWLAAALVPEWALRSALCRIASVQGQPYVPAEWADIVGTSTQPGLASRQAILATFSVAVPSPNRKRVYLSGWSEVANDEGVPASGTLGGILSWMAAINGITTINGKAVQHVVTRRSGNPAYVTSHNALTTVQVSTGFADLQSRREG